MAIKTNSFSDALFQACSDFPPAKSAPTEFYYRHHVWKTVIDTVNRCIHVFPLDGAAGSVSYCW